MSVRVSINGFGRIGRNILRSIIESGRDDIKVVGINDLGPVETNAHLLRYDTVHGRFPAYGKALKKLKGVHLFLFYFTMRPLIELTTSI